MAFLEAFKQRHGNRVVKFGTAQSSDSRYVRALDGVALNAAAGSRTVEIVTDGLEEIRVNVEFTYNAATSVSITAFHSDNYGASYSQPTSVSISSGTGTLSLYSESIATAASTNFETTFDVKGANAMKFVFAGGGTPGSSDTINVYVTGVSR